MSEGRRGQRVSEDIREYLSGILRTEVSDPRLTGLVVTTVKLSADLGLADVSVRSLTGASSPREQQSIIRALTNAGGRLRHLLGGRLNMKRNPQLRFHYDTAPEVRGRVDELLDEIRREDAGQRHGDVKGSEESAPDQPPPGQSTEQSTEQSESSRGETRRDSPARDDD